MRSQHRKGSSIQLGTYWTNTNVRGGVSGSLVITHHNSYPIRPRPNTAHRSKAQSFQLVGKMFWLISRAYFAGIY